MPSLAVTQPQYPRELDLGVEKPSDLGHYSDADGPSDRQLESALAAVTTIQGALEGLKIVDTDPNSATFGTVVGYKYPKHVASGVTAPTKKSTWVGYLTTASTGAIDLAAALKAGGVTVVNKPTNRITPQDLLESPAICDNQG